MAEPCTYDTRPMTGGAADLVDCARLAGSAATVERGYAIDTLPRLHDLLTSHAGTVRARFAFGVAEAGGPRVDVTVAGTVEILCQRCLLPFSFPIHAHTELELVPPEAADRPGAEREMAVMQDGVASLRELAEEELLLALPVAPACGMPETCGRAPTGAAGAGRPVHEETVRPFSALQDLMKNFDRK
jgi:uncharacterized protein